MSAPVTFAKSRRKRYAACGDVVRITGLRFAFEQGSSPDRKTKNKNHRTLTAMVLFLVRITGLEPAQYCYH